MPVANVFQYSTDKHQIVVARFRIFSGKPLGISISISRLEPVVLAIHDVGRSIDGDGGHEVNVEIVSVIQRHAAVLAPLVDNVFVPIGFLEFVVQPIGIIFRLPTGLKLHFTKQVNIEIHVFGCRLNDRLLPM